MVGVLIATALLGLMVEFVDNWGHTGGALTGAAIGFAHRILIQTAHRPVAKWLGGLAILLLIASGGAHVAAMTALGVPRRARRGIQSQFRVSVDAAELAAFDASEKMIQILSQSREFFSPGREMISSSERVLWLIPEGDRHIRKPSSATVRGGRGLASTSRCRSWIRRTRNFAPS